MLSERILQFYRDLRLDVTLPEGIHAMNPYQNDEAFGYCKAFYQRYFNDDRKRKVIMGINPGRFGGGITGVPFTDPIKLERCGIINPFKKKAELSADFIYAMIDAYGGPEKFYGEYFLTALSPLGFVKDEKNLNYYDSKELLKAVEPFMVVCVRETIAMGMDATTCFCLGEGENYKYLAQLNERYHFFEHIVPLPHPRFIMQYKRKEITAYIKHYTDTLSYERHKNRL